MIDSASERSGSEVERLIAKGRYKEALKQAKIAHKRSGSAADRLTVERMYGLRAGQLVRAGMLDSAREVVDNLLAFGVTAGGWSADLEWLLVRLGRERQARRLAVGFAGAEGSARIDVVEADWSVVDPSGEGQAVSGEAAGQARQIREALAAILADEPERGLELLRSLTWNSPLAEWKFFARGLVALRRGDQASADVNWGRLDSSRAAARIVAKLRTIAGASGPPLAESVIDRLEQQAFGAPISERIRGMGTLALADQWAELIPTLGQLRRALEPTAEALCERLTALALGPLARSVAGLDRARALARVEAFIAVARPLAIDPHWNRFWAFVWDGPHAQKTGTIAYWGHYLEDLDAAARFDPATRDLAKALVWQRIAQGFLAGGGQGVEAALDCLSKSLQLAPDHLPCHRLRLSILEDPSDGARFAEAAGRLLDVAPDDLETLLALVRHHRARGEPGPALDHLLAARRARPIDRRLVELEDEIRLELAPDRATLAGQARGRS